MSKQGEVALTNLQKQQDEKVSGIHVFFLIHSVQSGVGGLSFQREITEVAGHDSWMAVLLGGVLVNLAIFFMYLALKKRGEDVVALHQRILGSRLGMIFSLMFMVYFISTGAAVLRTYIELVQVWVFPEISTWSISLVLILLIYYVISGGFQVVVGISVLSVILPFYLLLLLVFPLQHADFTNLLPIGQLSFKELMGATKAMTFSYLGFCTLLMYYPLLKDGPRTQKFAHIGASYTTLIYFVVILISVAYYSEKQLLANVWPTFGLFKIVRFPFVERFEYVGVATWSFVILDNVCLLLWASHRVLKRLWPQSRSILFMVIVLSLIFLENILLTGRRDIATFNQWVTYWGLGINFLYLPLLYLLGLAKGWRGRAT
ncbi:GerAB/ArcD/ProY family transporter [Marininema halotolerans]|uniref:Spore germination protein (Amino acid permease) n=1 Tax=Marininema halotolerans TaxID=1155944 RepID=A0A1I6Q3W1_9BACL|nr:GerAB/ArcD/ProY family transporter [Marininema halotolerans]SFS47171.1 spore germination protein (amino acid permease) [Marininema halotolerans]